MSKNLSDFRIEKLHYGHAVREFDCGDDNVNKYFYERSYEDVEIKNAQVYVFTQREEIIGFYTISTKSVRFMPEGQKKELVYPVLLIGQLGVNKPFQGKAWGPLIINKALEKGDSTSKEVGCMGLIVETHNEKLIEKFYKPLGFIQVRNDKGRYTLFHRFSSEEGSAF